MNQLIQFNDKNSKGRQILSDNTFFKDLCNLMKNVEFARFYDNYFKDWSDILYEVV